MPIRRFLALVLFVISSAILVPPTFALVRDPRLAPIPQKPGGILQKDEIARHVAWSKRVLLSPMIERSKGKPWAEEAAIFAGKAAPYLVRSEEDIPKEVAKLGERLVVQQGCDDPCIIYLAGRMQRPGHIPDVFPWYKKAIPDAAKLPGSKALHWLLLRELAGMTPGSHYFPEFAGFPDLTQQVLTDGSFTAADHEVFTRDLIEHPEFKASYKVYARVAESPTLAAWARKTIAGYCTLLEFKAKFQMQNSVPDPAASNALLIQATRALGEAWELRPDRPEAAWAMITVAFHAMDDDALSARRWFDRAVTAQFDYSPAYRSIQTAFRRIGEPGLLLSFAEICFATGRMETIVPRFLLPAVQQVAVETGDWKSAYRQRPEIARAVIAVSKAFVERAVEPSVREEALSFLAVNAFLAGDIELAVETCADLDFSDGAPAIEARLTESAKDKLWAHDIKDFGAQVARATPPDAAEHARKRAMARAQKPAAMPGGTVLEGSAAVAPGPTAIPTNPSNATNAQLAREAFAREFATLAWVSLPIEPEHPMWAVPGPYPDPIAAAVPPGGKMQRSRFNFSFPVGENFEVSATLKPVRNPNRSPVLFYFSGRKSGESEPYPASKDWAYVSAMIEGTNTLLLVADSARGPLVSAPVPPFTTECAIVFRLQDDRITVELNGKPVLKNVPAPERPAWMQQMLFAFQAPPVVTAALTDLKIRKLPSQKQPAAPAAPPGKKPGQNRDAA